MPQSRNFSEEAFAFKKVSPREGTALQEASPFFISRPSLVRLLPLKIPQPRFSNFRPSLFQPVPSFSRAPRPNRESPFFSSLALLPIRLFSFRSSRLLFLSFSRSRFFRSSVLDISLLSFSVAASSLLSRVPSRDFRNSDCHPLRQRRASSPSPPGVRTPRGVSLHACLFAASFRA